MPKSGLKIEIIGDCGPFSKLGKSIGYIFSYKNSRFLLDCGTSVFEQIGVDGLRNLKGLVGTHSHDDHKRWFTDMALYMRYTPGINKQLTLIAADPIHEEWEKNSRAALERTLTNDQKQIIEMPYEMFVRKIYIGPRAKWRITPTLVDPADSGSGIRWQVIGPNGETAPASKAKIVINHLEKANRPRLLFFDDRYHEWVEPFSYYDFSDDYFYEQDQRTYIDDDTGMKISPVVAHSWHGPPTVGIRLETQDENFLFTSDTVYNVDLWRELYQEKREQVFSDEISPEKFKKSALLFGNINDFIERTWSKRRWEVAMHAYENCVFLHDCYSRNGIVHTDYTQIASYPEPERMILTHTPDVFTSAHHLASVGKVFRIIGEKIYEDVDDKVLEYDADYYMKDMHRRYVGYKDDKGRWRIVSDRGVLHFVRREQESKYEHVGYVEVFEDFCGHYFPMLDDPENQEYYLRKDGRVELITRAESGTRGEFAKDIRAQVMKKYRGAKVRSTRKRSANTIRRSMRSL